MKALEVNGRTVELDGEGYLLHFEEWEKDVALILAKEEKLELNDDHWVVVQLLRDFYLVNKSIPTTKEVTRSMGEVLGNDKGNNKYLSQLFPKKSLMQSGKIAGLPRMPGCT